MLAVSARICEVYEENYFHTQLHSWKEVASQELSTSARQKRSMATKTKVLSHLYSIVRIAAQFNRPGKYVTATVGGLILGACVYSITIDILLSGYTF